MKWKNEALVGLVVIAGILTALAGAVWLSGQSFGGDEREITATFRGVGALEEGNPVKVRGVTVGRVSAIRLSERGDGVFVTMTVRPDIVMPSDAGVLLASESLFGDWMAQIVSRGQYPDLEFVSTQRGQVLPGAALPDISELTAVAARISGDIETLSDRIQLAFTEETAVKIRQTLENVSEVSDQLEGFIGQQTRTYDQVSRNVLESTANVRNATGTFAATATDVRTTINRGDVQAILANARRASANLETLSSQLGASAGGVPAVLTGVDSTVAAFRATAQALNATISSLQPAMAEVGPTLVEARRATTALSAAITAIQQGNGTLGRLATDPALYEETQRAIVTMRRLLADIQQNPAKYIGQVQVF
ncbi:MAG TPA: MlaD family protein [Longimicrobium sp.]|jgi:phospholipid/cholesterol/gamma-HCH transport system substrate-binding protein